MILVRTFALLSAAFVLFLGTQPASAITTTACTATAATTIADGVCYFDATSLTTWNAHLALAEAKAGGDWSLVSIHSSVQNSFVGSFSSSTAIFWIGFTDEVNEGDFLWTDGTTVDYDNWGPGEPNDCCGGEDFTVYSQSSGQWIDTNPSFAALQAVYSAAISDPIPEPGPLAIFSLGLAGLGLMRRRRAA